jgi:hypothetical protein
MRESLIASPATQFIFGTTNLSGDLNINTNQKPEGTFQEVAIVMVSIHPYCQGLLMATVLK